MSVYKKPTQQHGLMTPTPITQPYTKREYIETKPKYGIGSAPKTSFKELLYTYKPSAVYGRVKEELGKAKDKGVKGNVRELGQDIYRGGKSYLIAEGGALIKPAVSGLRYVGAVKSAKYEKFLPVRKVVDKLPNFLTKARIPLTRTNVGNVLTSGLSTGRNVALDVVGTVGVTYGVKKSVTAATPFSGEEKTLRKSEDYESYKKMAKARVAEKAGPVQKFFYNWAPGVPLVSKTYKESYKKELGLIGEEYNLSEQDTKALQTSSKKDLWAEQLSYGTGLLYAGAASELRGTTSVAKKTYKQSTSFAKKWLQFGVPIGKAGIGEGMGSVASYDIAQSNKQDFKTRKPYIRYAASAGIGFASAGLIGGFIPAATSSAKGSVRFLGKGVNWAANLLDPTEKPSDVIAHYGVDPLRRRAGVVVPSPAITMDVTPPKKGKGWITQTFGFSSKKSTNIINNNINTEFRTPTQERTTVATRTKIPVINAAINFPVNPRTNIPILINPRTDVPIPIIEQIPVDTPISVVTDIPVKPEIPLPVQPRVQLQVPINPNVDVPVSVVTPSKMGFASGLMFPLGGFSKTASGKKPKYGYLPSLSAVLFGITGKKKQASFSGYYSGQEFRPIVGISRPKTKSNKKKVTKKRKKKEEDWFKMPKSMSF